MDFDDILADAKKEVEELEEYAKPDVWIDPAKEDASCFTCSIHNPALCPWPESRYDDRFTSDFLRSFCCANYRPAQLPDL